MWLEKYPRLEQDSILCLIINDRSYKFKHKVRRNNFQHNITHKKNCKCEEYYKVVSQMTKFSYSIVGKCLNQRSYTNKLNYEPTDTTYIEKKIPLLLFHEMPHTTTNKLVTRRFQTFPSYEKQPNILTIYTLLTLLKTEDFNFQTLTKYLDVIEIATIYLLLNGIFTSRFIENLLPNYCRSLRYIDTIRSDNTHRDILTEIYAKFFNRDLRTQFPDINYISMSLRPIRLCRSIPEQPEIVQLGYIGERFVMHINNGSIHIMNDFGEYMGVYPEHIDYPFNLENNCIFECIKTKHICYIVDIYVHNKHLVYNKPPRVRSNILKSIEIQDTSTIKLAPLLNQDDVLTYMDISDELLNNGYNNLSYDSFIFRCKNENNISKFYIKKPRLKFNISGSVIAEKLSYNYTYSSKYTGYFLLQSQGNKSWSINVWDSDRFTRVGTLPTQLSFKTTKTNILAKIFFNSKKGTKVEEIENVIIKKYKSIYNCLSLEDLV